MRIRHALALCLACTLAAGCNQAAENGNSAASANQAGAAGEPERSNIGEALSRSADHSSFMQAIETAGLTETLRGAGPYTVFAPVNAAFSALPEEARRGLTENEQRERLVDLLSYHIVPGTVTAEDLRRAIDRNPGGRAELATVAGGNLSLSRDGDAILVADGAGSQARIAQADQIRSNGVVHSIDAVLMPPAE